MAARSDKQNAARSMSLIVTKGTLDWAYPPFILASTAAAMDMKVTMFFTFYGLGLLEKDLDLSVTSLGNSAMKMPALGGHMAMPNWIGMLPGMTGVTSRMMKRMIAKSGVSSVEDLREAARISGVRLIACQMTMDLLGYKTDTMIEGVEVAGAATYLENAVDCDINLYI